MLHSTIETTLFFYVSTNKIKVTECNSSGSRFVNALALQAGFEQVSRIEEEVFLFIRSAVGSVDQGREIFFECCSEGTDFESDLYTICNYYLFGKSRELGQNYTSKYEEFHYKMMHLLRRV